MLPHGNRCLHGNRERRGGGGGGGLLAKQLTLTCATARAPSTATLRAASVAAFLTGMSPRSAWPHTKFAVVFAAAHTLFNIRRRGPVHQSSTDLQNKYDGLRGDL